MTRRGLWIEIALLVVLGALYRLLPHLPNATPLGAIALRARARFGIAGLSIPLGALVLSDIAIGFYDWRLLAAVYVSFAAVGMLGRSLTYSPSTVKVLWISAVGSFLFFVITNGAVWTLSPWYEKSLEGLLLCYAMGLPFLRNMLIGDAVFGLLLFRLWPSHAQYLYRGEGPVHQKLEHSASPT